jgi:Septum formation
MTRPTTMPSPERTVTIWQRCAAVLAAAVVLGGCGAAADLVEAEPTDEPSPTEPTSPSPTSPSPTSPTSASPSPTPPVVAKPKVGECRRIDSFQTVLGADTTERQPLPCGETHNAQTYFVGLMNQAMQDTATSGNAVRLRSEISPVCRRELTEWLGGSGEDAAYSAFRFVVTAPSPDAVGSGVRWFSCDLFATRVANDFKLTSLPPDTRGILTTDNAGQWSLCNRGNFQGGTTNLVICTRPHTYRAIGGIHLGDADTKYPGSNRMDRTLESACVGKVRAYLGTSAGFNYGWTYPGRDDWNDGNHWGLCYLKTGS